MQPHTIHVSYSSRATQDTQLLPPSFGLKSVTDTLLRAAASSTARGSRVRASSVEREG